MPWSKKHLQWLVNTGRTLTIACGTKVPVWEFRHTKDETILSAWAKHFRNHYCRDTEIDILRNGTGLSRGEFLRQIKFPDRLNAPGPSIRSGDVAEILVADYLQFVLQFWVPRTRYSNKASRNESTKGTDILGFKISDPKKESTKDTLAMFETKAQLSATPTTSRLQNAVNGSATDQVRRAESLNAAKQRLHAESDHDGAMRIERFQDPEDRPYTEQFGAAAIFSTASFSEQIERAADTSSHPFAKNLALLVIHGKDMMALVNDLYERAANEA